VPLHYSWKLFGRPSPWPRRFLFWVGYLAGARTRIVGTPLKRHVLFVSNHLSWLDIMVIAGATGAAFVSKDDVAGWPVIGWLARLNNTVFVARTERKAVRGQADALRAALASGQPVALFPEGTTAGGAEILPFRASLLSSLFPPIPDVKVQPVASITAAPPTTSPGSATSPRQPMRGACCRGRERRRSRSASSIRSIRPR